MPSYTARNSVAPMANSARTGGTTRRCCHGHSNVVEATWSNPKPGMPDRATRLSLHLERIGQNAHHFPFVSGTLGIYMKKIMVGNAPSSLRYLFPINPTRDQIKINIPTPGIDLFKTSLTFSGASLWNSLPLSLKTQSSKLFKKHYLSYLTSLP